MHNHEHHPLPRRTTLQVPSRSPIQTVFGIVAGTALIGAGLAFALVVSATVLTIGAIGATYVLWKTRTVRRELREKIETAYRTAPAESGYIVEGEVIRQER